MFTCDEHPDRPSIKVVQVSGGLLDCCAECAADWDRRGAAADGEARSAAARASFGHYRATAR